MQFQPWATLGLWVCLWGSCADMTCSDYQALRQLLNVCYSDYVIRPVCFLVTVLLMRTNCTLNLPKLQLIRCSR
jgi:hypothetical protein